MFVIGTAGHVDHGKSLLVEALTGIDPDRLREEKARGMTIDLGFAWLTLPSGREVSIVDVPGHERFIKNMLAGAGGVDLALLVVAADDGVMPQTREHLAILDLLGVSRGVVALTKRDLVDDDWLALVNADIEELLGGTTLAGSPIVPCSALTGAGLDDLRAALDDATSALPPKGEIGRPRLPIDRVFTIGGFGTVVTGTLVDGELATGMEVEVVPGHLRGRIRGLQSHRASVERALPGTRTAVNINGIEKDALRRGMVLTSPGWLTATEVVDARVRAIAPLRHNMRLTLHTGAAEAPAILRLLEDDGLAAGADAWAQVKLDAPVAIVRGDRFVLRTANDTVGGGTVVDIAPKRHRRRHQPTFDALARLGTDDPADLVFDAIARAPLASGGTLAASVSIALAERESALSSLLAGGRIGAIDAGETRYATRAWLDAIATNARDILAAHHAQHPLRAGMPREELRSRLGIESRAFDALAATWDGVRMAQGSVALSSHVPAPSPNQQRAIDEALASLRASPYAPPTVRLDPEVLAYLQAATQVVDAGDGVVFDAEAYGDMEGRVRSHIETHGRITIADARDLFGTSRRYAQALLEHMDRSRVTRRAGDDHVLR